MNVHRPWALLALLLGFAGHAGELPPDSLYQLRAPLVAQNGQAGTLDLHRGHPTLVTMFYASCPHVCPTLIAGMQNMERQLAASARQRLRVLLVSVDPARDTPAQLDQLAQRHRTDTDRWTFARMEENDVRKLAAALGIRYRQLPDGEFNHSTVISLLDADGRIVRQTSTARDTDFLDQLRAATAGGGSR